MIEWSAVHQPKGGLEAHEGIHSELPKKISGYMGLSKIKVPKNDNNEDTLRVWGVPPHFQPPYNVRQDLTMRLMRPSKISVDQCPSSSLVPILTHNSGRFLPPQALTDHTRCHRSVRHDDCLLQLVPPRPDCSLRPAFFLRKLQMRMCRRTGDLPSGKHTKSYWKWPWK